MRKLVEWTNDTLQDLYLHPLITIGVFIVHFLSIHPFTDGNGRLSRALTVLLMLKNKYDYMPYTSIVNGRFIPEIEVNIQAPAKQIKTYPKKRAFSLCLK